MPAPAPSPFTGAVCDDGPLLTTSEAAAVLRVHPKQIYRLLRRGLPARRVGHQWRFERPALLAWGQVNEAARQEETAAPDPTCHAEPPLLASNGDAVVELLLEAVRGGGSRLLGSVAADREQGLALLRGAEVLAAGHHGAPLPQAVPEGQLARIHLVRREVGLVARRGEPTRLEQVGERRLASRPSTAGCRLVLDEALAAAGRDGQEVHRAARLFASHRDVVAALVRGDCDIGIATHAWAKRFGLSFSPLCEEDYSLLVFAGSLGRPEVVRLCQVAQSATWRARVERLGGYDARGAGLAHLAN